MKRSVMVISLGLCVTAVWFYHAKRPGETRSAVLASGNLAPSPVEDAATAEKEASPTVDPPALEDPEGIEGPDESGAPALTAERNVANIAMTAWDAEGNIPPGFGWGNMPPDFGWDGAMVTMPTVGQPMWDNTHAVTNMEESGMPALHTAVATGDGETVRLLLEQGADINAYEPHGNTPLIIAVGRNDIEQVKLILEVGGDVNMKNLNGDTALLMAVWAEQIELAEVLLKAGADPRIKNHDEETAFNLAKSKGNSQMMQIMEKY